MPTITERTLRKWRKEALIVRDALEPHEGNIVDSSWIKVCDRVLRMTQELLDQHLLRKD